MILLLSGEGATDLGTCRLPGADCEGRDFEPGPMAWLVDGMVGNIWGYSPLNAAACVLVPKTALAIHCRTERMGPALPGKKRGTETAYFFKNARGLARMALRWSAQKDCPVGAVLFRDTDGTASSPRSLWSDKVNSMEAGFEAEGFVLGVPMVPKPKSEAWLLCALQTVPYQDCSRLEDLPGNDGSPNSAKDELDKTLDRRGKSYGDVPQLIEDGAIDPHRIQMPSFDRFRECLESVATRMLRGGALGASRSGG